MLLLNKIIFSVVLIIVAFILTKIFQKQSAKSSRLYRLKVTQRKLLKKLYSLGMSILVIFGIIFIWGIEIQQFWVFLTGILGLVAIGFFAVWSILSNIFSGLVILTSKHYGIEDEIIIMGDDIKGVIKDITLMFTILEDKKGNKINIPNNLLVQKIVKVINNKNNDRNKK